MTHREKVVTRRKGLSPNKVCVAVLGCGAVVLALQLQITTALGQDSPPPPSAPAPTVKPLDQIEARTPIGTARTITKSGAYYLTKNIKVTSGNAITINASNVVLDLNGFTISSTAASI